MVVGMLSNMGTNGFIFCRFYNLFNIKNICKMKISILHPSRGRASKSGENAREWISKIGENVSHELIVSIDNSDPQKNRYYEKYSHEWLLNPNAKDRSIIIEGNNNSVVEATNRAAKESTGDILVYLSDDFKCPNDWGIKVIKEFENENRPLLIKVDDCLQKFHIPVLTIPIMNRSLYTKLGYFWHPDFKSMFCDEHLYWISMKHGAIKMCEHLKFPHEHPANGKAPNDETYRRSAANWDQGKAAFEKHKRSGFPL